MRSSGATVGVQVGERNESFWRWALASGTALLFPTLGHGAFEIGALLAGERLSPLAAFHELARLDEVDGIDARLAAKCCEANQQKAEVSNVFHNATSLSAIGRVRQHILRAVAWSILE